MKRVLLDHCVPRPFRNQLVGCVVSTANEMGWADWKNGELHSILTQLLTAVRESK